WRFRESAAADWSTPEAPSSCRERSRVARSDCSRAAAPAFVRAGWVSRILRPSMVRGFSFALPSAPWLATRLRTLADAHRHGPHLRAVPRFAPAEVLRANPHTVGRAQPDRAAHRSDRRPDPARNASGFGTGRTPGHRRR